MKRSLYAAAALLAAYVGASAWKLPDVGELRDHNPATTAFMDFRQTQALKKGSDSLPYQVWTPIEEISPNLVHAVLLAEDDTFYRHHGFDLQQIQIAVKMDWEKGRYVYGGSTLTQQLARNLYLSPEKTLSRKLREALIAWKLEHTLTKRRILELYLNVAEWGPGIYGAQAAARTYFGKDASELNVEEAVALACALPSPRRFNPFANTDKLLKRRENVLQRMKEAGFLVAASR